MNWTLLALIAIFLAGCVSTSWHPSGPFFPARGANAPIDVYYSGSVSSFAEARPEHEAPSHANIGTIQLETGLAVPFSKVIRKAKEKARLMGADAIVVYQRSDFQADLNVHTLVRAIRYR